MFILNVNLEDQESGRTTHIRKAFPEVPVWNELTEVFLDALKAESYCFKSGTKLGLVDDSYDAPYTAPMGHFFQCEECENNPRNYSA